LCQRSRCPYGHGVGNGGRVISCLVEGKRSKGRKEEEVKEGRKKKKERKEKEGRKEN
jgi:hypothetical protein